MSASFSQSFRASSSSKVISIPTRNDTMTGLRVILWKDIQWCFKDAQYILCNNDVVLFLTNDRLDEYIPPRIAHHPGVVLEVVVLDNNPKDSSTMKPSRPTLVFEPSSSSNGDTQMDGDLFTARDVAALRITELDDDKQAFTTHPQIPASEQRLSLYSSSQHHHVYARPSVVPPQGHSILSLDESTHGLPGESQSGMDIIMAQQEQLKQLKEQAQQLQQQLEDSLQKRQQLQQQLDESLQKAQQQQQQIHAMNQNGHPPGHSSEKQGHQAMPQRMPDTSHLRKLALDRLLAIQKDIYSKPNLDSREMSYPRLFVVLPTTAGIVNTHDESYATQFRLHFLCECGYHTMSKKSVGMHAIHLTQHPGYALNNPSEFFDKYGSYLLTMLYMIKYGAKTEGIMVPSVVHLETTTDQEDFDVTKSTGRLVDEMTAHLEKRLGNNMAVTTHKALDASELDQLGSYLKTEGDEASSGDLKQTITQDENRVWICSKHIREYHDSILQRFRDIITANGDHYWQEKEGEIQIEFEHINDTLQKGLYDAMVKVCRAQSAGHQKPLTVLDLRYGFHHSTGLLINLDIFSVEYLVFKFGRLSMTVSTIHHGFKDVAMTIQQLGSLTSDDIKLLRRCRPVTLTVIDAQDGDEHRLVDILQHNPRIAEIHIRECQFRFALAIIDRVISKRIKDIQNEFLVALRVFHVTSRCWKCDNVDMGAITATVQFTEGSFEYTMETNIEMRRCREYDNEDSFVCDFARQYGWSIKTLQVSMWLNDRFAMMLDESTRGRNSLIEHFNAIPTSLTTYGVDAMDRFIKRSQNFLSIELALEKLQDKAQLEKALLVLQRYKDRLTRLALIGTPAESWLPQFAQAFPSNESFPMMESFTMEQHTARRVSKDPNMIVEASLWDQIGSIVQQWIVSMVSTPAQPSLLLKSFVCRGIILRSRHWEGIILAIDFSALETMVFENCEFEQEQLELLVDHIADNYRSPLPLKQLSVGGCIGIEAVEAKLRLSAPNAHISRESG